LQTAEGINRMDDYDNRVGQKRTILKRVQLLYMMTYAFDVSECSALSEVSALF